jgi:hypothetical protein
MGEKGGHMGFCYGGVKIINKYIGMIWVEWEINKRV